MEKIDKSLEYNQILGSIGLNSSQRTEFNHKAYQLDNKAKENTWGNFVQYLFWVSIAAIAIIPLIDIFNKHEDRLFLLINEKNPSEILDKNWYPKLAIIWLFLFPTFIITIYKFIHYFYPAPFINNGIVTLHRAIYERVYKPNQRKLYSLGKLGNSQIQALTDATLSEWVVHYIKHTSFRFLLFCVPLLILLSVIFTYCLKSYFVISNDGITFHSLIEDKKFNSWQQIDKIDTSCTNRKKYNPEFSYVLTFKDGNSANFAQFGHYFVRDKQIANFIELSKQWNVKNIKFNSYFSSMCEALILERMPLQGKKLIEVLKGE